MKPKLTLLASLLIALLVGVLIYRPRASQTSEVARVEDKANVTINLLPVEDNASEIAFSRTSIAPPTDKRDELPTLLVVDELCGTHLKYHAQSLDPRTFIDGGTQEWSVTSPGYRQQVVSIESEQHRIELRAKTEVNITFVHEDARGQRTPLQGVHLIRAQKVELNQQAASWNDSKALHQFASSRAGRASIFSNSPVRCEWGVTGYPNVTAVVVPGRRNTVVIYDSDRPHTRFTFIDYRSSSPMVNLDVMFESDGIGLGRVRTNDSGEAALLLPFGPTTLMFSPAIKPTHIESEAAPLDFAKLGQERYIVMRDTELEIEVQCLLDLHQIQVLDQSSGQPISGAISYATIRPLDNGYYTVGKEATAAIRSGTAWMDLSAFLYSRDWLSADRLAIDVVGFRRKVIESPSALKSLGAIYLERAMAVSLKVVWENGDALNDTVDIYSAFSSKLVHTLQSGSGAVAKFWWDGSDLVVCPRSSEQTLDLPGASIIPGEVSIARFPLSGAEFELSDVPDMVSDIVLLSASERSYSDPVANIIPCHIQEASVQGVNTSTWGAANIPAGRYYFGTLDDVQRALMHGVRDNFKRALSIEDGERFVAKWSGSDPAILAADMKLHIDGISASQSEFLAVPLPGMDGKISFTQIMKTISVDRDGSFTIPAGSRTPVDVLLMVVPKSSHPDLASPWPLGVYPINGRLFVRPGRLTTDRIQVGESEEATASPLVCLVNLETSEMGDFSTYFTDEDVDVPFLSADGFEVDCFASITQSTQIFLRGLRTLIPTELERTGVDAVIFQAR